MNGRDKVHTLRKAEPERIEYLLNDLKDTSGRKMTRLGGNEVRTKTPSIQGPWQANLPAPLESKIEHFVDSP